MTRKTALRLALFALFLISAAGCVSPISKSYRHEAKIEGVNFPSVLQDPDGYLGDTVIWGGTILSTNNTPEGTEIFVMEQPVGIEDRPAWKKGSRGRFIAKSPKFLDPAVYQTGREITLAGEVAGKQTLPIGNAEYTYPVVLVRQIHLWRESPQSYTFSGNPNPGWTGPFGYYDEFGGNIGQGMLQEQAEKRR